MNLLITVLVAMILCHLIADYPLQGWLAQAKTKSYWQNGPAKNKHDWIAALIAHATMWSIIVMIPMLVASKMELGWAWLVLPFNIIGHVIIDHGKANKHTINLIEDQLMHLVQILLSWGLWAYTCLDNRVAYLIGTGVTFGYFIIKLVIDIILELKRDIKQQNIK